MHGLCGNERRVGLVARWLLSAISGRWRQGQTFPDSGRSSGRFALIAETVHWGSHPGRSRTARTALTSFRASGTFRTMAQA
jgi:hypothetical protein